MKKITSIFRKHFFIILFLLGLLTIPASLIFTHINIQTDMLSLLPMEEQNPIKSESFERFSQAAANKIIILFSHPDKDTAFKTAVDFVQKNQGQEFLNNADFYVATENKLDDYFAYRYHLLGTKQQQLLLKNKGEEVQEKALRSIYSPMGMGLSRTPADDPFMLFNSFFMELPFLQSSLFPYNGVLMAEYENTHYAMLTLNLPKGSAFSAGSSNLIPDLNAALEESKISHPGSNNILSGIPIHSYYSSNSSKSELSFIGNISLLLTILLIYFTFKSGRELFLSLFSMGLGCAVAFAITHYIFGQIHLLTLIFGTSLIGVAIDYSFPFFCEFLDNKNIPTNAGAISEVTPGLTMGLITSMMGYAALALTPFPGLQQMACFSIVGLIVSYLIVVILYPAVYKPVAHRKKHFLVNYAEKFFMVFEKIASIKTSIIIFTLLIIITAAGLYNLKANDDIKLLYTPQKQLIENEIISRKIMGQNKASQFFLVTAASQEELLQKEEGLSAKLDISAQDGKLASHVALSQIVPSMRKQAENYQLIKENLLTPYLEKQVKELSITSSDIAKIKNDFKAQENQFLHLDAALQNPSFKMIAPLFLGKIGDSYASVILLNNLSKNANLQNLASETDGIYFMDKLSDITNLFSKYRHIAAKMLAIAYLLILVFLYFRYGLARALLVFCPPVLAGFLTLALISFAGYQINLFNILSLFLILAFGIDYTAFYAESSARKITTSIAIFLSFITNILSFGLLSFSNFPVIHSFGIVMFIGMILVYLLSPLVTLAPGKK